MSAGVGLGFVPGSEGQIQFLCHFPVVLDKRRHLELVHVEQRIAERLCKLQRPSSEIKVKTRKRKRSEEIVLLCRVVPSVEALKTSLDGPLRAGIHQQIAELGIPVVAQIVVLPASAIKRIKNVDRLSSQTGRGLRKIFPVFEPDLVHERLR